LKKSQKWEADIFGIGAEFQRSMSSYWKDIKDNWDEIYRELEVEVNVTSNIRQFGLLEKPPFSEYHLSEEEKQEQGEKGEKGEE